MGSIRRKKTSRTSSFLYFYLFRVSVLSLFCLRQFEWSSRLQNKKRRVKRKEGKKL